MENLLNYTRTMNEVYKWAILVGIPSAIAISIYAYKVFKKPSIDRRGKERITKHLDR